MAYLGVIEQKESNARKGTFAVPPQPIGRERGRRRVVIENVWPELDAGRHPIKRIVGEKVIAEADIFADGHDTLSAVLLFRQAGESKWKEAPLRPSINDRWRGEFVVELIGDAYYCLEAWVDYFESWRRGTQTKLTAQQDISTELLTGARLIEAGARRAEGADMARLKNWAGQVAGGGPDALEVRARLALSVEVANAMARYPDRSLATRYVRELRVVVDPRLARFGAWYEMFPRSCPGKASRHGTFNDVERHLRCIADMGFDVLYFPPIHPIGESYRKGKNNNAHCDAGEPGSPWAIGASAGGHKAIHPELGTLEDFRRLVTKAGELKIEIALDIAFQCSPDHPYVKEHPEWFKKRADGSIQYAENPPKKYEDIYPLDFECDDWRGLWRELKSVIDFWIEQGVRVFRVDNPHTKALGFWEWLIGGVKAAHPETLFLAEAFTRPKLMYSLAKLGFTQSYNYFPWRNTKWELTEYFNEVDQAPVREFFRPNLWTNTPDILPQYLQYGGRSAFLARFIAAATLGATYGIYGPAFELCVDQGREPGGEEYLDSEKYEIKDWPLTQPGNLSDLIAHVNKLRRENPALQRDDRLCFHATDNQQIIAYSKTTEADDSAILTVVNLDPHHMQSGWVTLSLKALGLSPQETFQVHDLLTAERYLWHGSRNYVQLDPESVPAAIFRIRRRVRTERDFDYFL
jgi:starch synthase (maltosyl-transferring)